MREEPDATQSKYSTDAGHGFVRADSNCYAAKLIRLTQFQLFNLGRPKDTRYNY